ncbi:glycerophosphodiester phosphodiesterase [Sphingomonas baiyangensis]|uniref:glycerophosphodiester phosphodiesterase n=1 Tax=Sphingomonas baiyangensis TaxID=2572576 RepID=A0A4U1L8E1_9SPHN|nr:glycerophosphodiester phosphodiesterase [Sphingomonas baiyangensis]TKD53232.1 glycerophosphodiester phosphodiesterase [Sphingomonas baiyangensis]
MVSAALALIFAGTAGCTTAREAGITQAPRILVIAHRGASGERPEHTLAAYDLAIEQGADFIEPDLVLTRDGALVARHENDITQTTDVAEHPEFADRRATRTIDGVTHTGWFTEDFTLAELKTLRAKERLPDLRPGNARFDGQFAVPTLAEVIALAKRRSAETGRMIGIYPETKHPSYFAARGLDFDAPLLAALREAGWDRADAPVFVQSFEVDNLRRLARQTRVPLVQLVASAGAPADGAAASYAEMLSDTGLAAIARYARGLGPEKSLVVTNEGDDTGLARRARAAGLQVHPWTFRAENYFLPERDRIGADPKATGRLADEIARHVAAGVTGFFTDFPYLGVEARNGARGGE